MLDSSVTFPGEAIRAAIVIVALHPAATNTGTPAGSYGWNGIYGTQFWMDPRNRVIGVVMTQTALIGAALTNPVRDALYATE